MPGAQRRRSRAEGEPAKPPFVSDDVVRMPRLGESIVEATLVRWCVRPGDRVRAGQIIVEVETDKATNEIPAPRDGVVAALEAEEGQTYEVGTPILRYEPDAAAAGENVEATAPPVAGPSAFAPDRPGSRLAPRPLDASGRPIPCAPSVRRLARARGVDLRSVVGTGRRGRITRKDLDRPASAPFRGVATAPAATDGGPTAAPPRAAEPRPPNPRDRIVRLEGRRRRIAEGLAEAQRTAVQVFALTEIDMSRVEARRAEAKARGVRAPHTAFIVQAILQAMETRPELNATLRDDEICVHADRHIGVAVDTEHGLVVPVVHHANRYTLEGLADRIAELADRARRRALKAEDLTGGTFTLSNPGRDGNLVGVSILRTPEVGILRTGAVTKRPVVRTIDGEDHLVIRPVMTAALTYDHRAIDGRTGNLFLTAVRAALEAG